MDRNITHSKIQLFST